VQTFLGTASDSRQAANLAWLAQQGIRVTLRIEEPALGHETDSYYDWPAQLGIFNRVRAVQALVNVEAVIVGNEPQSGYDLTWQSGNWGNNPDAYFTEAGGKAAKHNREVAAMVSLLRPLGVQIISPGWEHRRVRPEQPAQPGRATWRELCLPSYNACHGNGAHLYADSWASPEDDNRYKWAFGEEVERCHKALWINETNQHNPDATPVQKMRSCMAMYDLLMTLPDANRVVSYCPFVSNTGGPGYDQTYVMRDPQCYTELAAWLAASP
jgi:hypothetical protein